MPSAMQRRLAQGGAPERARRPARPASPAGRSRAAPIVKWAGGKSKLVGELLARAPSDYRRYFEPFVGGGALFFRIAPRAAVLGDQNPDLMRMYRAVAKDVESVLRRLEAHAQRHDHDYYYQVRSQWNAGAFGSEAARAAAFIYLNKTCYNGLWRVNSRGLFNVPVGRYAKPSIYEPEALRAAARALAAADLVTGSFEDSVARAEPGDFVYFDPPYQPVSETANFTSYTAGSFGENDQRELADAARELASRGCAVMISNSDVPLIRRLYRGFSVSRVTCARAINSAGDKRGRVAEVIITNNPTRSRAPKRPRKR